MCVYIQNNCKKRGTRFSDVMDMAKRSQYTLTGLVINAFTDSVILDWNQLGTINPGGDDEEEETMYTRQLQRNLTDIQK